MADHIEKLAKRLAELNTEIKTLEAAVEADGRTMSPEEIQKLAGLNAEFDATTADINLRNRASERDAALSNLSAPAPRKIEPLPTTATATQPQPALAATRTAITGGTPVAHNYSNHGFVKGAGEFLMAVYRAGTEGYRDPRLMVNAITTFAGEGVGADGAFALPPQYTANIMNAVMPEDSFLRALNPVQTSSNLLVAPVNENPPWGASGITSAKTSEGAAITPSKPAIKEVRITMYKAAALVHVSEEALADIPFLSSWVMDQMGQHLRYQLENWVVNGTGEGEPLGILKSPALIALADVDSDATTIGAGQVLTMESCLLPGSGSAFWVASPTVYPALGTMKTGSAGYPLVQPDMTIASRQALLGRPFYRSEACPILNVQGDLILVQPGGYIFALKAGGVQTATTVGFAFDQDAQSFRATIRAGGGGLLSAKVERAKSAGSTFASHFITNVGGKS